MLSLLFFCEVVLSLLSMSFLLFCNILTHIFSLVLYDIFFFEINTL